ncbi:hypothetical protein GGI16_008175 [Coemansia sp. S142-1]|nr:hypothetical protein GGH13_007414 [Coemansia sp. S155-1]KAJ2077224.1 hypothetical protein GGI16_008175 [Coemansia sp. S142-1]
MNYPPYTEKNNGATAPGVPAGPVYQPPHGAAQGAAPPYNPALHQPNTDYNASRGYHGGGTHYQHYAPPPPGQQQYYAQQPYYQQQPGGYPQYVYVHQVPRSSHGATGVFGCLSAVLAGICCAGLLC